MTYHFRLRALLGTLLALALPPTLAAPVTLTAVLSGAAEAPPNGSPGSGFLTLTLDDSLHTLGIDLSFSDLVAPTTAAHIHCCTATPFAGTAGVATMLPTFPGFPLGVTSGSYQQIFDTSLDSFFSNAFLAANGGNAAGAEAALFAGLNAGRAYFNIHTTAFPGGEIRGFPVSEPGALALVALALLALGRCRLSSLRAPS